jgi:hypothetical protein
LLQPIAAVASGISAWQKDKRVIGLWSIKQNRTSLAYIGGVGWKKLVDNAERAIEALTRLRAHAHEKRSVIDCHNQSGGMIYDSTGWAPLPPSLRLRVERVGMKHGE